MKSQCITGLERRITRWEHEHVLEAVQERLDKNPEAMRVRGSVTAGFFQIYFSVAHDPTKLNRQAPDIGTQYRSAIFPVNLEQARIAQAYIAQLNNARVFDGAIVTKIEPDNAFYPAEAYHQDFLVQHPNHPYIVVNDLPKIGGLKRLFPEIYRSDPVLTPAPMN